MASTPKQISFTVNDETLQLLETLKKDMGAPTTAALIRKALTLAELAIERGKDSNGIVSIVGHNRPQDEAIRLSIRT